MEEPQLRIFTLHNHAFTLPSSLCFNLFCRQILLNSPKVLFANTLPFPNIRAFHPLPSILRAVSPKIIVRSNSEPQLYEKYQWVAKMTCISSPFASLPQKVKNSPNGSVNLSSYWLSSLLRCVWQDYREQWDLKPVSWIIGWEVERTLQF